MHGQQSGSILPKRHLVLLVDGTGVTAARLDTKSRHSNIYRLNLALRNHNERSEAQITFYMPGIGSSFAGRRPKAEALGRGLVRDVEHAYINICSNYHPGDENSPADSLYFFGFSRGAVIVRLLAGIISRFGLLKEEYVHEFGNIWDASLGIKTENQVADLLSPACSHRVVPIQFVGVFDTVFGFYRGEYDRELENHFFRNRLLPHRVRRAIHLLAINESRSQFKPILWSDVEEPRESTRGSLEQIWMPGVHTDVGGGYESEFFANVALLTMLHRIREHTELKVNSGYVQEVHKDFLKELGAAKTEIVINDEKANALWRLLGLATDAGLRHFGHPDKYQFIHPICHRLQNKRIVMKSEPATTLYQLGQCDLEAVQLQEFFLEYNG